MYCTIHEAGACYDGCPDAYDERDISSKEITVELDATEPEALFEIETPGSIWLRRLPVEPMTGWPVVLVRGPMNEVIPYVREHWGDDEAGRVVGEWS